MGVLLKSLRGKIVESDFMESFKSMEIWSCLLSSRFLLQLFCWLDSSFDILSCLHWFFGSFNSKVILLQFFMNRHWTMKYSASRNDLQMKISSIEIVFLTSDVNVSFFQKNFENISNYNQSQSWYSK